MESVNAETWATEANFKRPASKMKLFLALVGVISLNYALAADSISVSNWARTLDLSSQFVKSSNLVTFKNDGSGSVKSVVFTVDDDEVDKVVGSISQLN